MTAAGLLIRDVELAGGRRADVRIASGLITELGELKPLTAEVVLDGCGGGLSARPATLHRARSPRGHDCAGDSGPGRRGVDPRRRLRRASRPAGTGVARPAAARHPATRATP